MDYTKRRVSCKAKGLSETEARESLQSSPKYAGAEVLGLEKQNGKWVATILVPKTAGPPPFPPKGEDNEESKPETEDSEDSGPPEDAAPEPFKDEGPDADEGEGPPKGEKPKGEKGELAELLTLVPLIHQIAEKLGIGGAPEIPGAGDGPMPGPDGPPPPGPPAPAKPPGAGGKLKPGELPNKPGVVPIGAPAFASTNGSGDLDLGRVGSFDAFDDTPGKTVKQAHAELDALYGPHGFRVRQIKRVENGQRLAAKLSRK
jgi:hypothetical protein